MRYQILRQLLQKNLPHQSVSSNSQYLMSYTLYISYLLFLNQYVLSVFLPAAEVCSICMSYEYRAQYNFTTIFSTLFPLILFIEVVAISHLANYSLSRYLSIRVYSVHASLLICSLYSIPCKQCQMMDYYQLLPIVVGRYDRSHVTCNGTSVLLTPYQLQILSHNWRLRQVYQTYTRVYPQQTYTNFVVSLITANETIIHKQ